MECIQERNRTRCNCTYEPCSRKHKCCECLHYHRQQDQLPACFFNAAYEKTYDRSVANFMRMRGK
ncbi:MAG: DUF6485 family protein [Thermodesulfovibrionales bacterium]